MLASWPGPAPALPCLHGPVAGDGCCRACASRPTQASSQALPACACSPPRAAGWLTVLRGPSGGSPAQQQCDQPGRRQRRCRSCMRVCMCARPAPSGRSKRTLAERQAERCSRLCLPVACPFAQQENPPNQSWSGCIRPGNITRPTPHAQQRPLVSRCTLGGAGTRQAMTYGAGAGCRPSRAAPAG